MKQVIAIGVELLFGAGLWRFLMLQTRYPHERKIPTPKTLTATITFDSDYTGMVI